MRDVSTCYHCGLPCYGEIFYTVISSVSQSMCCIGCQAVSQAIVDNGLINYYSFRAKSAVSQSNVIPPELLEYQAYDLPDIKNKYLSPDCADSVSKEMIISVDGITCAACVWLLERRMSTLQGIHRFSVNLSNHRALVYWDDEKIALSDIFVEMAKIGYRGQPFEVKREEVRRKQEQRNALKCLAVSGLGFGQVMMFAAPLYDWFSLGIPNHYRDFFRLVSLVVTTPVLIYCGLPFFKSAWISLKSKIFSMDVSISFALLSVYLAGIYATVMRTGEVYFDSITMFLFFITLTRYLEMRSRYYSSFIVQKLSHQPPDAVLIIKS